MNAVTDSALDTSIRVNGKRLWDSLMTMAKIGATKKGAEVISFSDVIAMAT